MLILNQRMDLHVIYKTLTSNKSRTICIVLLVKHTPDHDTTLSHFIILLLFLLVVRQQTSNAHSYHRPLHSGVVVVQATTLDVCDEMADGMLLFLKIEVITSEQEVPNTHVHSNTSI